MRWLQHASRGWVKRVLLTVDRYRITKAAIAVVLADQDYGEVEWVLPAVKTSKVDPLLSEEELDLEMAKDGEMLYLVDLNLLGAAQAAQQCPNGWVRNVNNK